LVVKKIKILNFTTEITGVPRTDGRRFVGFDPVTDVITANMK